MANTPSPDPHRELLDIRRRLYFEGADTSPEVETESVARSAEDALEGMEFSSGGGATDVPGLTDNLPRPAAPPAGPTFRGDDLLSRSDRSIPLVAELQSENETLRREAEELRALLLEMRGLLEEASKHDPELAAQREADLRQQLAEKDEANRLLHEQLQEIERQVAESSAPPPSEEDLVAMSDELERERCQMSQQRRELEDDRRQLREDEEALMKQMREMEVQMARERAEMARQRTELQRLHMEVRHELESIQRGDGALNARLAQFQRRHADLQARHGVGAGGDGPAPAPPAADAPAPRRESGNGNGIVRRLFGDR
jgi:hypothetical protein